MVRILLEMLLRLLNLDESRLSWNCQIYPSWKTVLALCNQFSYSSTNTLTKLSTNINSFQVARVSPTTAWRSARGAVTGQLRDNSLQITADCFEEI